MRNPRYFLEIGLKGENVIRRANGTVVYRLREGDDRYARQLLLNLNGGKRNAA
jgi:hypothetical protein